jgi:hypothetical protein
MLRGIGMSILARACLYGIEHHVTFSHMAERLAAVDWHVLKIERSALRQGEGEDYREAVYANANPLWFECACGGRGPPPHLFVLRGRPYPAGMIVLGKIGIDAIRQALAPGARGSFDASHESGIGPSRRFAARIKALDSRQLSERSGNRSLGGLGRCAF